ncbi:hypothetical protein BJB45_04460 [Halomonas huangheensis]|uniref:Uncharacterized protein n=1 Tax=Halomonas huangheensis TaxID=1178482 RepID=W1N496_9GAMM|nr:hypothetical protein BJB45_04460 [Halomonas huangheensis]
MGKRVAVAVGHWTEGKGLKPSAENAQRAKFQWLQ